MEPADQLWTVEFVDFVAVTKSLKRLSVQERSVALRALVFDLETYGLNIFASDRAKWLGSGLAEFRYRKDPSVLIRFFFFIDGTRCFIVLSAYDKKRDPSPSRQQAEIAKARKIVEKVLRK